MFPKNTRVLLIDDSENIRVLVKSELESIGLEGPFYEAENAKAGMAILESQLKAKAPIQLVVCDWNMPGETGIQMLKQIRSRSEFKVLPFVLLTSESNPEQVLDAAAAGVSNYIVKPFTPEILRQKLVAAWKKHNS